MPKHLLPWLALLISFAMLALLPTWHDVQRRSLKGSDFATYYYAVKLAQSGDENLLVSVDSPLTKTAVVKELKKRFYKRQTALFISRDTASFQTVARIKESSLKGGLEVRLDSSKQSLQTKRKRANGNGLLFTLETNPNDGLSFDLYTNSKWLNTISSHDVEGDLHAALSETSGTYLPNRERLIVRPSGQSPSAVTISFHQGRVASILTEDGKQLERISIQTALRNPNSPYDAKALSRAAMKDRKKVDINQDGKIDKSEIIGRKSVHPFLYPPPALMVTAWVTSFSLPTAYILFHVVLWSAFLLSLWFFRRWLKTPWFALAFVAVVFSPVPDSIKMGQINLIVLLFMILALSLRSGLALSVAGMIKMSPALLVAPFACFGNIRFPLMALFGAVLLSLMALTFVGFEEQVNFYSVLLPQFSSGEYLGLKIPIDMKGNHSLPNLFHQIWPGDSRYVLSVTAKKASSILLIFFLIALSTWTIRCRNGGRRALEESSGAFVALMVLTPVYAYEHHMVFMLVPIFVVYRHLREGTSPASAKLLFLLSTLFLSLPWPWIKEWGRELPALEWFLQESKCLSSLLMMGLCMWAAHRTHSAFNAR